MLTITKPESPKGPHTKTEADGSKTHYLGQVHINIGPASKSKGESHV